jgi:hypothetical protein
MDGHVAHMVKIRNAKRILVTSSEQEHHLAARISFNYVETITCFGPRKPSSEGTQHLRNSELLSFWAKLKKKPVLLSVIHQAQNPSESTCGSALQLQRPSVQQFQPIRVN